ncbi:hypothetical protein AV274_4372 [Blastocystis sp. ATCC 50177/Nand II]|uniref:Uncharacterized protein n=1 Tax=Blastocystis sp. subtype 1 (strain ATCC 50177 / NandII) TaxID=478820 RepID=A0A196S9Z4_BLAHN|nr:hypothetical protein AV274_4372 [Blastocystis sp. ATCC 50177/Nand II]
MRKRIRLSLVERVEGDGEQGRDSDSDHIQVEEHDEVNDQPVSSDNAFPVFVPKRVSAIKRPKRSASILNVPESRRDDVLALYNRILASSSRKIDERRFPKAPYSVDSYDVASIASDLNKQKKQNALLLKTLTSLTEEAEKEASVALTRDAANLQSEIEQAERSLAALNRSNPREWAMETQGGEEEAVRSHRQGTLSMWRRCKTYTPTRKWEGLEEEVNERLMKEKPLRAVIKRMAVVDAALSERVSNK